MSTYTTSSSSNTMTKVPTKSTAKATEKHNEFLLYSVNKTELYIKLKQDVIYPMWTNESLPNKERMIFTVPDPMNLIEKGLTATVHLPNNIIIHVNINEVYNFSDSYKIVDAGLPSL